MAKDPLGVVLLEIPLLSSGFGSWEAFITIPGSGILSNKPGQDGRGTGRHQYRSV